MNAEIRTKKYVAHGVDRAAIEDAIGGLVNDTFAYAERHDEERNRYTGLKVTGGGSVIIDSQSVM